MEINWLTNKDHEHCWHTHRGPIHMVIPNGHTVQQCCKCQATRTVHADHTHEHRHEGGQRRW